MCIRDRGYPLSEVEQIVVDAKTTDADEADAAEFEGDNFDE